MSLPFAKKKKHSPLILSEFTGSAHSLGGAIITNPWDEAEVARALNKVLKMKEPERDLRHSHNFRYVTKYTAYFWIRSLLKDLALTVINETTFEAKLLDSEDLATKFSQSKHRVLVLDYDGTLTPIVSSPQEAAPSATILSILDTLAKNEKNSIYVVSGRDKNSLCGWLGYLPIGLSCEHGCFFRPISKNGSEPVWVDIALDLNLSWKEPVRKIMEDYTEKTAGSMMEIKEINLTWHYRNAEQDFAAFMANELQSTLATLATKLPFDILTGHKVIEVRPRGINKGFVVRSVMALEPQADFVLCLGDDRTDEDMFCVLSKYGEQKQIPNIFNCMIGRKSGRADHYLDSQDDVTQLLQTLSKIS